MYYQTVIVNMTNLDNQVRIDREVHKKIRVISAVYDVGMSKLVGIMVEDLDPDILIKRGYKKNENIRI